MGAFKSHWAGRFSAYLLLEVLGNSVKSPKSIHNSIVGGESTYLHRPRMR
jgi:hypothetical protein